MEISFDNLLIVVAAGFFAPLVIGMVPGSACLRSCSRS